MEDALDMSSDRILNECHCRTIHTLRLLSPLNRNQHGGQAKLCGVENMTNTQKKLLKVVRDITEQSVNHNLFSFLSLCLIPNYIANERKVCK